MNYRIPLSYIAVASVVLLFLADIALGEDVRALGIRRTGVRMETANESGIDKDACDNFQIDKIRLDVVSTGDLTTPGTVSVLDPRMQKITAKKVLSGQEAYLNVGVRNVDDTLAQNFKLLLLKVQPEDGRQEIIDRAETNQQGQAVFAERISAGEYQVAQECDDSGSLAVPIGGLLWVGAIAGTTVLAIELADEFESSNSSGSAVVNFPATSSGNSSGASAMASSSSRSRFPVATNENEVTAIGRPRNKISARDRLWQAPEGRRQQPASL